MKYIKTYENNEEPKRFIIEKEYSNLYIWQVIRKNARKKKDVDDYYMIKNIFRYENGKSNNDHSPPFGTSKKMLYENMVYQTDDLDDALEKVELLITANTYNL